jgi:hypothetical protein
LVLVANVGGVFAPGKSTTSIDNEKGDDSVLLQAQNFFYLIYLAQLGQHRDLFSFDCEVGKKEAKLSSRQLGIRTRASKTTQKIRLPRARLTQTFSSWLGPLVVVRIVTPVCLVVCDGYFTSPRKERT